MTHPVHASALSIQPETHQTSQGSRNVESFLACSAEPGCWEPMAMLWHSPQWPRPSTL